MGITSLECVWKKLLCDEKILAYDKVMHGWICLLLLHLWELLVSCLFIFHVTAPSEASGLEETDQIPGLHLIWSAFDLDCDLVLF